jgi:ABC-2 type transport system ATP-binding protein
MLTINNLTVSYGDKIILENLQVNFEMAKIHGLVGLNGAGKTTLLNTIYGFKAKDTGQVLLDEEPLKRTDVAYLETENFYYSNITGKEYLSLFSRSTNDYDLDEWNKLFKLPLDKLIDSYSTGMKKKLAVMAVLKQDKKILILDEPFNGLDIESSKILSLIIDKLKEKEKTILITSHILQSLTNICDYIHYLDKKTIAFTRDKNNFSNIENEIFKDMEAGHKELIDQIIS